MSPIIVDTRWAGELRDDHGHPLVSFDVIIGGRVHEAAMRVHVGDGVVHGSEYPCTEAGSVPSVRDTFKHWMTEDAALRQAVIDAVLGEAAR